MNLQEWANKNEPSKEMIWKNGYWDQICFVRDSITGIFTHTFDEYKAIRENIQVVSTHRSKSIDLPVYRIFLLSGEKFTIRYNFYNWKISVDSPIEINCNFYDLLSGNEKIDHIYCEGFEREWVFDSYQNNKKQFTVEIFTEYQVYTFFWLIAKHIEERKQNESKNR